MTLGQGRCPHDVVRRRGCEEQRLTAAGERGDDTPDVGPKTHVQHPIGLVEHQHLEPVEVRRLTLQVIEQSPGRRHDEVDSRAQRLCLPLRADAAVHRDARERRAVRKPIEVFVDLSGELAGRREHQDARGRGDRVGAAVCSGEQSLHDRQEERGGHCQVKQFGGFLAARRHR